MISNDKWSCSKPERLRRGAAPVFTIMGVASSRFFEDIVLRYRRLHLVFEPSCWDLEWFAAGLVACVISLSPGAVNGQETSSEGASFPESISGDVIVIDPPGLQVQRPSGWIEGTPEGERTAILLRIAGGENAQMEVRRSHPIRSNEAGAFFTAFHNELKAAGFAEIKQLSDATYGSFSGREIEYEGRTEGMTYRLIIWQFQLGESAWIVTGFFPKARRDALYQDFRTLIRSFDFVSN